MIVYSHSEWKIRYLSVLFTFIFCSHFKDVSVKLVVIMAFYGESRCGRDECEDIRVRFSVIVVQDIQLNGTCCDF